MKRKYLYNSAGEWIAFLSGKYVFDIDGNWIGWLPEGGSDVVDPEGKYIGTVVEERLYRFITKSDPEYPGYPGSPDDIEYPGYPGSTGAQPLPPLAEDVDLHESRKN